ncbi:MAG: hypothetical protein U0414_31990 [Polyangiaceae bacterium]
MPPPKLLGLTALILSSVACGDGNAANGMCRSIGLCDRPTLPAVQIDVLCDPSADSSCSTDTLTKTVDASLRFSVARPGSRIRLFMLDTSSASLVGEQMVPKGGKGSDRARRASADRFVDAARQFFLAGATTALEQPHARRSPIAEGLTKLALAEHGDLPRSVFIISDAREVSTIGDLECTPLPKPEAFFTNLKKAHLLGAGLFAGADVMFVYEEFKPTPARACPVSVEREMRVRDLWTGALRAAGASDVRFSAGPPSFLDEGRDDEKAGAP